VRNLYILQQRNEHQKQFLTEHRGVTSHCLHNHSNRCLLYSELHSKGRQKVKVAHALSIVIHIDDFGWPWTDI